MEYRFRRPPRRAQPQPYDLPGNGMNETIAYTNSDRKGRDMQLALGNSSMQLVLGNSSPCVLSHHPLQIAFGRPLRSAFWFQFEI